MSNSFTLAEAYEETRPAIAKVILADLKSKHSLSLGEKDGQTTVNVFDRDGKPKFLNNGNTPVTIKNLLEEAYKPFIKKNNSDEQRGESNRETRFHVDQQNQNPKIRQGSSTSVNNRI
jgi:hypothetical protein